jgi:hypothetical protein
MAFRQLQSLVKRLRKDRLKDQQKSLRRSQVRRALSERLEDRRMFAGPELLAIRPDAGALLRSGDTLNVAPREFNLLFEGGADLDASTISASTIRLFRSGGDGTFTDGNEVAVALGYVGLENPGDTDAENLQKIVLRPASSASHNATDPANSFPDDTYQIQVLGAGAQFLRNNLGEAFNGGENSITNFRLDRGAQVISVVPQPISRNTQLLTIGATGGSFRLTFRGEITRTLPFNASSGAIELALRELSNINDTDVSVGGVPGLREITFQGQYAGEQVPLLEVFNGGLTGGVATVSRSNVLTQASNQVVVYFDDQQLNSAEVVDPKFYRLINTAGTLTINDDQVLLPQGVTYDSAQNSVVLTFASAIPEGNYRLDVGKSGGLDDVFTQALVVGALSDGNPFISNQFLGDVNGSSADATDKDIFKVDLRFGATLSLTIAASTPGLALRARVIDRNGDPIPGATITTTVGGTATLPVVISATNPYFIEVVSANGTVGSYQINASVTGTPIQQNDANTTISTATSLGSLGAAAITIPGAITPQLIPLPPLPGGEDDPGHREIQRESHIDSVGTTPTLPADTVVVEYYFPPSLGLDPSGQSYTNFITETEKQIVRDIFELFAKKSGFEFVEAQGVGALMIGKGSLQALDPTIGPNSGVAGLGGPGGVVLNNTLFNQANRFYGDGFTGVMFHEIGHALGLGHSYDQLSVMGQGVANDVLLGDVDVIHLQRIVPPNSTDIDMYRFTLDQAGRFTAETCLPSDSRTPSQLNSVLTLYRQLAGGDVEMVARNDQYFGADAFMDLNLTPGTYFIGVSSAGNTNYDPRVPDSGFGGTTNGAYELKLGFKADRNDLMRDSDGTVIDGDSDGTPGGVYSFWFQASDPANTIYVDKATTAATRTGALATPYDTISAAFNVASSRIVIPSTATSAALTTQGFVIDDGINPARRFTYNPTQQQLNDGHLPIALVGSDTGLSIATKTRAAVLAARTNGQLGASVNVVNTGRVVQFSGISKLDISSSATLLASQNIVRIVGNGGSDQNINTTAENRPYLLGLSVNDVPLADGT